MHTHFVYTCSHNLYTHTVALIHTTVCVRIQSGHTHHFSRIQTQLYDYGNFYLYQLIGDVIGSSGSSNANRHRSRSRWSHVWLCPPWKRAISSSCFLRETFWKWNLRRCGQSSPTMTTASTRDPLKDTLKKTKWSSKRQKSITIYRSVTKRLLPKRKKRLCQKGRDWILIHLRRQSIETSL